MPADRSYQHRMQSPRAVGNFTGRSVRVAAILSFLIVGLGHWYLGAWRRALAWELGLFAAAFVGVVIGVPDFLFGPLAVGIAAASAGDAWRVGLKSGASKGWDWFAIPFAIGTIVLGIAVWVALLYLACETGQGCL